MLSLIGNNADRLPHQSFQKQYSTCLLFSHVWYLMAIWYLIMCHFHFYLFLGNHPELGGSDGKESACDAGEPGFPIPFKYQLSWCYRDWPFKKWKGTKMLYTILKQFIKMSPNSWCQLLTRYCVSLFNWPAYLIMAVFGYLLMGSLREKRKHHLRQFHVNTWKREVK